MLCKIYMYCMNITFFPSQKGCGGDYTQPCPPPLTGKLEDKPTTRGQSSRRLDNSQTSQLADSDLKKRNYCTLFVH